MCEGAQNFTNSTLPLALGLNIYPGIYTFETLIQYKFSYPYTITQPQHLAISISVLSNLTSQDFSPPVRYTQH